jgi:hypothetical protein
MSTILKNSGDRAKAQMPPVFKDTVVVKIMDHEFGMSKSDNPMITLKHIEIVGVPNTTGGIDSDVTVGGQKYKIAGQRTQPKWYALKEGFPLDQYETFWKAAHPGEEFPGVDIENPDRAFLDDLAMYAVVQVRSEVQRKHVTPEEREALKAEGKEAPAILGHDGKELTRQSVEVVEWLAKYTGELPVY